MRPQLDREGQSRFWVGYVANAETRQILEGCLHMHRQESAALRCAERRVSRRNREAKRFEWERLDFLNRRLYL